MRLRHALSVLLLVGCVGAVTAEAQAPAARFAGRYAVTFRVTNAHVAATHWIFSPTSSCSGPCTSVAFRLRLTTEKSWRPTVLHYTLRAQGYQLRRVLPRFANCSSTAGKTVAHGYDVVSTETLRVTRTVDGVTVAFVGDGRDTYQPNAKGKAAGCKVGAYIFAITGNRQ